MSDETPPAPLEWHPAYRDKTWLLDWLEGRGDYPQDRLDLPVVQPLRLDEFDVDAVSAPRISRLVLTKRKAWGPAPYVGRPFVYGWYVATDQLGRSIASESRIVYTNEDTIALQRGD